MKILEIIIPHETLNENRITNWFARPFARSAGNTAEARVSSWVDDAIRQVEAANPGHTITRTKELKQAESALVAVMERNPYPDELAKIDSLATSLSEYLISTGRSRVAGDNAIEIIADLVRKGSIPPPSVYGSKAEFLSDPFIITELRGLATATGARIELAGSKYIRELAEVRTQVYKEIKNIEPVKTKAQKKKEEKAAELAKTKQDAEELRAKNKLQKEINTADDLKILQATRDGRSFWKRNRIALVFAGTEVGRISVQTGQQINNIETWKYGWKDNTPIPPEIAKFFPIVPKDGVKEGEPSIKALVTDWDGKPYYYRTKKQRYEKAAWYAWHTITGLWVKQAASGTVAWFAPGIFGKSVKLVGVGGVTFTANLVGKGKWAHSVVEYFNKAWANSPILVKWLGGLSLTSRMLFADYMMTNVVPEQDASQNLAYWINSVVGEATGIPSGAAAKTSNELGWTEFTPEELADARKGLSLLPDYQNPIELNKALAAISIGADIEELPEGYVKEFLLNGLKTYGVPYIVATNAIIETIKAFVEAAAYIAPLMVKAMGTTKGKLPNNNDTPVAPPAALPVAPPPSDANAQQDQGALSGDQSTTTDTTPPAVAKPEAKPSADARTSPSSKIKPSDNGYLDESINESLKRRVAQLMKS